MEWIVGSRLRRSDDDNGKNAPQKQESVPALQTFAYHARTAGCHKRRVIAVMRRPAAAERPGLLKECIKGLRPG
jgi:hypothetical protein